MTDVRNLKEALFALQTKKRLIEGVMEECIDRLKACGCLNEEPLVDAEGFPRSDIDIISVVQDRKQLKELQNDHKAIMKDLEEGLHRVHALDRRHGDYEDNAVRARVVQVEAEAPLQTVDAVTSEPDPRRAFALVDEVFENSPSSVAGVRVGDEIVRCKHVTFETPNALEVFAGLVKASENEELDVVMRRGESTMRVTLTPSVWSGRGLLGCHLAPKHG
jgi:26S proteasome non-ATPase regulatory subunit 9